MEDIKIGRASGGQATAVTVSDVAWTRIAPADPLRTALTVSTDGTRPMFVWPGGPPPAITAGFLLSGTVPFHTFPLEHWGSLMRQDWWAVAQGAPALAFVADVQLQRQE